MKEWWKVIIIWFIAYFVGVVAQRLHEIHPFIAVIFITVGYLVWRVLFDFWFL